MFKHAFAAFIAFWGLNSAAVAQTASGGACSLPSIVDTAPLEHIAGTDLMTVPVEINGSAEHFLLDIGTGQTEIAQTTVAKAGLPANPKRTETIGGERGPIMQGLPMGGVDLGSLTNGGLGNVSVHDVRDNSGSGARETRVRISSFTIGRANNRNMMFLVANDAEMGSSSEPYDGLLTGDFFKQYDIELDFSAKEINWLTPTKCTDPNQVVFWSHSEVGVIPITVKDGKFQVPVTAGGHQINAVIDTSSSRTVMRRDIAEVLLGIKPGTDMSLDGDLKDGKGQPVYLYTFPEISFAGGVVATNVPALILANSLTHEINSGVVLGSWARSTDAPIPDLTLGMDVLHQLHIYVVPGQGKMYVTSAQ